MSNNPFANGEGSRRSSYGAVEGTVSPRISQVQSEVEDLKQIMVRNIDSLANRGEKLELLIDRSENLEVGVSCSCSTIE